MYKRTLLRQIEIEMVSAYNSLEFWQTQLPLHQFEPLKGTVQRSLQSAVSRLQHLEEAKKVVAGA